MLLTKSMSVLFLVDKYSHAERLPVCTHNSSLARASVARGGQWEVENADDAREL